MSDQTNEDDSEIVVCYGGAGPADAHLLATVHCVDDEITEYLEQPRAMPLALTDWQLEQVLAAAASIPAEQRGVWLQDIANRHGSSRATPTCAEPSRETMPEADMRRMHSNPRPGRGL